MLFEIILRLYNERENDIEYDLKIIVDKYLNQFLKSRLSTIIDCDSNFASDCSFNFLFELEREKIWKRSGYSKFSILSLE